jgi:hypothetical protein
MTFLPQKSVNFDNCFSSRPDDILLVSDPGSLIPNRLGIFVEWMDSLGIKEKQTTSEKFLAESKTAICCSGSGFLTFVRKTTEGVFSIQRIGNSNIYSDSGDTGSTKPANHSGKFTK